MTLCYTPFLRQGDGDGGGDDDDDDDDDDYYPAVPQSAFLIQSGIDVDVDDNHDDDDDDDDDELQLLTHMSHFVPDQANAKQ